MPPKKTPFRGAQQTCSLVDSSLEKPKSPMKRRSATRIGLTKSGVKRLSLRGGLPVMPRILLPASDIFAEQFLRQVMRSAVAMMLHSKHKTLAPEHVLQCLQRKGINMFGYRR